MIAQGRGAPSLEPSLTELARAGLLGAAVRTSVDPPRRWLWPARRRWRAMVVLAWSVLAIGLTGGTVGQLIGDMKVEPGLAWLLGLLTTTPLAIAWRWPLAAWRIMVLGQLWVVLLYANPGVVWPWPVTSCLAMVFVLFQLAASHDRPVLLGVGILTPLLAVLPAVPLSDLSRWLGLILAGVVVLVLIFGDAVGGRYAAEVSLAQQAELRRQDLARQAVLEERARIARELHDVVAHHMSVIAVQAEAAPFKIAELPDSAKETFAMIRGAAVDALTETRRVVGLLRADSDTVERDPQPGLDRLDELVERGRHAGLTIERQVIGVPRRLPAGVEVSAYRIVQEALSNAAKHAPGSQVRVELGYEADGLRVVVTNGAGDTAAAGPGAGAADLGGGHGLVGMRERAAMLGGTLVAEPLSDAGFDAGFTVFARLPYGSEEQTT